MGGNWAGTLKFQLELQPDTPKNRTVVEFALHVLCILPGCLLRAQQEMTCLGRSALKGRARVPVLCGPAMRAGVSTGAGPGSWKELMTSGQLSGKSSLPCPRAHRFVPHHAAR